MALTGLRSGSSSKGSVSKTFQRKLEKKVQFYTKVKDTVASLNAKKEIKKKKRIRSHQKKLKAYDLTSLSEFLPELGNAPRQPLEESKLKLNSKSRQKLVEKESKHLKAVLSNRLFQSDPLSAIHLHLQSTQPLPTSNQQKRSNKSKKAKKKQSNASSAAQSMEM